MRPYHQHPLIPIGITIAILFLAHHSLEQAGKMGSGGMLFIIPVVEFLAISFLIAALFSEHIVDMLNRVRGTSRNRVPPSYVVKHFLIIASAIIFSIGAIYFLIIVIPSTKVLVAFN